MQEFLDDPTARSLADVSSLLMERPDAAVAAALAKTVLARRSSITLSGATHGLQLLRLLQQRSPGSYHVALVLPSGHAFVSATPERLFKRHGTSVLSEAVAGTYCLAEASYACLQQWQARR